MLNREVAQCRRALRQAEHGDPTAYRELLDRITHQGVSPESIRRGLTRDDVFYKLARQIGLAKLTA
jgi:hypothetical protein